jgi:hypothetical protein
MIRLRVFVQRLRGLFFKRGLERGVEDEIRSHLELQIEENMRGKSIYGLISSASMIEPSGCRSLADDLLPPDQSDHTGIVICPHCVPYAAGF